MLYSETLKLCNLETFFYSTQYKSNFCAGMLVKYDTRRP